MRLPGHPRPYYLSFLIRDEEAWCVTAKYGALSQDRHERRRHCFADVRVGSYRADQVRDGGLRDNDKEDESYGYVDLPYGTSADGLRHGLWRLADARYREAVQALLSKRSHGLSYRDPNRHLPSFEKRAPRSAVVWKPFPAVDRRRWAERVERLSGRLRRFARVKDSSVEFQAEHVCRVFVNSEGSRQIETQLTWSLECYLWFLSRRGHPMPWTLKHIVADPAELPGDEAFLAEIRRTVDKLERLADAPILQSYCGPALLDPVPAGLLIHEALGHRLEGSRLLDSGEGQTFKHSLGQAILPAFLDVRDDPTLERFGGRSLVGHYRYDDEGVEAQDARLVVGGRLRSFLTSRAGIAPRHRSNGHGRGDYHQRPTSRMGVLIVETRDGLPRRRLEQVLRDEIRRQKVPFGIRIVEAQSGETATDAYDFQAFLGEASLVAKVYPDGREEWVRGVNFVGTPVNAIRNVLAAGDEYAVDNAFCGAESGYLPVSTISPALVVSELELQSKAEPIYAPYSLAPPWKA
jgi:predicted Zn-dependent protease